MEPLEQRVGKLEDKVESLASLPDLVKMLIAEQKDTNTNIKELSGHMMETYVSKEVMQLTLGALDGKIKLWMIGTVLSGVCALTTALYYATHLGGK